VVNRLTDRHLCQSESHQHVSSSWLLRESNRNDRRCIRQAPFCNAARNCRLHWSLRSIHLILRRFLESNHRVFVIVETRRVLTFTLLGGLSLATFLGDVLCLNMQNTGVCPSLIFSFPAVLERKVGHWVMKCPFCWKHPELLRQLVRGGGR